MKITKNQSLALAVSIIVLFFIIGILLMPDNTTPPQDSQSIEPATPTAAAVEATISAAAAITPGTESKFVLKEYQRSEVRDGRKLWEAKGTQAQYFPETNSAKILNAKIWMYKKDGQVITIDAGEAVLHLQGAGLSGADASKGVTIVYNNQQSLETDKLTYDKAKSSVFAPGFVKIKGELLDISGEILEGDLEKNEFKLKKNVSSTLKPKVKKDETKAN